jgi:hypothetical protein
VPLDVVDQIRASIEPDPAIAKDPTGERPFEFEPETLYVWSEGEGRRIAAGQQDREEFEILILYVADNEGEEALQQRDPDVTEKLDMRRDAYLAWIRDHEATPAWDHLSGDADPDYVRGFEGRAVAVRASGYRFVED